MNDSPESMFRGELVHGYLDEQPVQVDDRVPQAGRDRLADTTLVAMAHEFAIFTHAPLFTYAGMPFPAMDPAQEFAQTRQAPGELMYCDFRAPIFRGMSGGRPEFECWDRRLCFISLADWPGLLAWMAAVTPCNRHAREYHRVRPQVLKIYDRLAVENRRLHGGSWPQEVTITVFTVTGNRHNIRFRPNLTDPDGCAKVDRLPLDRQLLIEADRVLGRHPDPILAGR